MTTQHISHGTRRKDARQGRRSVFSPRPAGVAASDTSMHTQGFQLFKPGSLRVSRPLVKVAPASVAGLVLACVSVTACRHAASQPIDGTQGQNPKAGLVVEPGANTALSPAQAYKQAGAKSHGKAFSPMRKTHADAAANTAAATPGNEPAAAATAQAPVDTTFAAPVAEGAAPATASLMTANAEAHPHPAPSAESAPTVSTTVALAQPGASWAAWGVPAAATVATSAALLLLVRRRTRRKKDARATGNVTVIGWKDWRYPAMTASRAEFFGAELPELPRVWPVHSVRLDSWAPSTGDAPQMKPATDGRYGLVKPMRPPKIDLSLDDDAFLHWVTGTQVPEPVDAGVAGEENVAASAPVDAALTPVETMEDVRRITEAAAPARDYDNSSSLSDGVAMATSVLSAQSPAAPAVQEAARAEDAAVAQPSQADAEAAQRNAVEREQQEREALLAAAQAREAMEREAAMREAQQREVAEREAAMREAQQRQAAEREAKKREAAEREAAQREAQQREAAQREAAEREAAQREAMRLEAQQREANAAKAKLEENSRQDAIAEAKKQLTAGYPAKALDALAPALAAPHASGEAWTVAGWCWWRTARDNGPNADKAVVQAIDAFHRAIAAEPSREAMLGSALIRCHLFMADHLQGDARAESLDAALRLMDRAAPTRQNDDNKFVLDHASALYERAMLSSPEARTHQLAQAEQRLASLSASDVDAEARWLMVSVWLAQAYHAQGRAADALLMRAADALSKVPADATQDMRDNWLARLIDVELLRLRELKAAARLMRLRQLRDTYVPKLQDVRTVLPLLSWIKVLREWAGMLSERPAREKFAEAEQLFERIESLSPDDIGAVHFARAYYLRLRSANESVGAALDTLEQADALLAHTRSQALSPETILLGRAEIALARAALVDPRERGAALKQAIHYSDASAAVEDGNLARALTCGITARLALFDIAKPTAGEARELVSLAERLRAAAPYEPDALRLSARCAFVAGHAADAARLCETAWDAGCHDAELLRLWRDSLTRLPNAPAEAANDPQWKRLNQCMRLAQSIGQSTR